MPSSRCSAVADLGAGPRSPTHTSCRRRSGSRRHAVADVGAAGDAAPGSRCRPCRRSRRRGRCRSRGSSRRTLSSGRRSCRRSVAADLARRRRHEGASQTVPWVSLGSQMRWPVRKQAPCWPFFADLGSGSPRRRCCCIVVGAVADLERMVSETICAMAPTVGRVVDEEGGAGAAATAMAFEAVADALSGWRSRSR